MPKTPKDRSYTVGYGKPPVPSQFKPGQSGNPKGRQKGSRNFKTEVQEVLRAQIVVNDNGRKRRISTQRGGLLKLVEKSLKNGETRALAELIKLATVHNNDLPQVDPEEALPPDEQAIFDFYVAERVEEAIVALAKEKSSRSRPRRNKAASDSKGPPGQGA